MKEDGERIPNGSQCIEHGLIVGGVFAREHIVGQQTAFDDDEGSQDDERENCQNVTIDAK